MSAQLTVVTCRDCRGSGRGPKPTDAELAGARGSKTGNAGWAAYALACTTCKGMGQVGIRTR